MKPRKFKFYEELKAILLENLEDDEDKDTVNNWWFRFDACSGLSFMFLILFYGTLFIYINLSKLLFFTIVSPL